MLSCHCGNLLDFLASKGIISWQWAGDLSELQARRHLLLSRESEIRDPPTRAYIADHESDIGFEECCEISRMLVSGVDGQAKQWWFMGGGFRSELVRAWIDLVQLYESKNLELIELGTKLRSVLVEISEAQKTLRDLNESIVANTEKRGTVTQTMEQLIPELTLTGSITQNSSEAEIFAFANSKAEEEASTLFAAADAALQDPTIQQCLSDHNLSSTLLSIEELYGILRAKSGDNPEDKSILTMLSCVTETRKILESAASANATHSARHITNNILLIQRRIRNCESKLAASDTTNIRLTEQLKNVSDQLNSYRFLRGRLITTIESKLKTHFPNGVALQIS
jgi:hypothetical protein